MAGPSIREILESLFHVGHPDPTTAPVPGPGPQLDGYRLYKQEAQASNEPVMEYADWIKQQPPVGAP